jgi:hypothetical protein
LVIISLEARVSPEGPGPTYTPTEAGEAPQPDARRPQRPFWRRMVGSH